MLVTVHGRRGFPLKVGLKVHGKSKSHPSANPKWLDWELPPVVKNQDLKYPSAFETVKRGAGLNGC
jgi:hypothetical protein